MEDAKAKLSRYLGPRRVKKNEPFTHTSKENPSASYYISDESTETFLTLYCNLVKKGGVMSLTEKPGAYGPLRVDFDMKASIDVGLERQFDEETIKEVIGYYQAEIKTCIPADEFEEKMLVCILLEKSGPRVDSGKVKDGFHLHFPHFICEGWIMDEHLRLRVVEKMVENKTWRKCKFTPETTTEKIIDSPMAKKPWLMYGSSKGSAYEPFMFWKAFDHDLAEMGLDEVFENELIGRPSTPEYYMPRLMSIRGYNECTALRKDLETRCAAMKNRKVRKANVKRKRTVEEVMADIKIIKDGDIMSMLSEDRADDFTTWMDVGWVLFNVTQGQDEGLQMWIDFSKKSSKFVDGECEERWSKMELRDKTIGSLFAMARTDNPDQYKEWKETQLKTILDNSLKESKPNEWDVGQVIYKLYGDRFRCADAKKDMWYEFCDHRWQYSDDSVSLRKLMATQVVDIYYKLIAQIAREDEENGTEDTRAKNKIRRTKCDAIISSLKSCTFMDKTLRMCKVIFHDPLFLKKIDENRLLFCCENGVLDLEFGVFREGRPDDYITLCCNVPYRKFTDEDDEMIEVTDFLKKVFPDEDLLNYFLDHACSCMEGGNVNKTFVIGTGSGDNGKSMTFALLETTFGDYCFKFPRELFVTGKTNTSAGARPELARVRGKRLAVISEIAKTDTLNIGILKELTGNDSFFARGLYEKGTEIKPMFTLILQCNEPPHVPGHDEATWNRIRVLDFKSKFVLPKHRAKYPVPDDPTEQMRIRRFKADLGLQKKLPDIAVALLSVLFERFKDYKKRGLKEPQDVILSTELYRSMNDIYLQFIKEKVEIVTYPENTPDKQKNFLKLQDLHAEFIAWYQENNSSYSKEKFNKITLLHEFSKKFGPYDKVGRIPGWYGYKIIDDIDSGIVDDKQKKLGDLLVGKAKAKATEIAMKKFKDITPAKAKSTGKKDGSVKKTASVKKEVAPKSAKAKGVGATKAR